jgi:hypothetical protein
LFTNELVGAEQRFEARHFSRDRSQRQRREVGVVGNQRDIRIASWRRNAVELGDFAVGPRNIDSQTLVDVRPYTSAEIRP